jgi:hypothetical protein
MRRKHRLQTWRGSPLALNTSAPSHGWIGSQQAAHGGMGGGV